MITENIINHRFTVNFQKYRYLLSQLVKRDIKIKYRRSVLGILWSFLNPLLTMIVLTIIFSTFFARNIENYPVFFLTGKLVFDFYAGGSKSAMSSVINNAATIKTIYVPKYMYSLAVILSNFVTFLLSLIILFGVMVFTNVQFTIYLIFASLPILFLLIFTIGMGLILATVTVFFRDIEHLYSVFLTMLMYATPIFYPPEIVPESIKFIQTLNPLYAIISCVRSSFMYGTLFDPSQLLFAALSAVSALVIGIILFYKYQDRFVLYI